MQRDFHWGFVVFGLLVVQGCSPASPDSYGPSDDTARAAERVSKPSQAHCTVQVDGKGSVDMELDYLPHVIACENNGAGLEALKAQAIAARSTAYYYIATSGSVCDSQSCQVYSCNNQPGPLHYQAVAETAQQYLSFGNMLTYGFYVAGDSSVSGPSCLDSSGGTSHHVTHNEGKTGNAVEQTGLGWVGPPGFGQNRGCMSQWGSRCLEDSGYDSTDILRFYYGDDIGVLTAPGTCAAPASPKETPAPPAPEQEAPANPGGADNSCAGFCGGEAPSGCFCDGDCLSYGDCCGDYSSTCASSGGNEQPPSPDPAPKAGSCVGSCNSTDPAPGADCYCDAYCQDFGDCCADYAMACQ